MPDFATQGLLLPSPWLSVIPSTKLGVAQSWFVKRAPLMAMLATLPMNNYKWDMIGYNYVPRSTLLRADIDNAVTTIPVNDASIFQVGDSVQINSVEVVEVTAANAAAQTLTVRRAAGGTAATAVTATGTTDVYNLGNSRTGGEKNQSALTQTPGSVSQFIQTFQHIVQVSGLMQAIGAVLPLPPEAPKPFDKAKMDALQHLVDDVENAGLYGYGEELGVNNVTRQKMKGLKQLIATNKVVSPTNASAYKPTDFERDALEPIREAGGEPGLIMISNKFRSGLSNWGVPLQRFSAGKTAFGVDIQYYTSSFMSDVPMVENMWLNRLGRAAIVLSVEDVCWRVLESLDYKPYARTGDTGVSGEGDWIHRAGIELKNEKRHSWVQGITGFAQQT